MAFEHGQPVSSIPWVSYLNDPAPGHVVVEAISQQLRVPFDAVTAAVVGGAHPAGNAVWAWVFRVDGMTGNEAKARWVAGTFEGRCAEQPQVGSLADLPATLVYRRYLKRCEPQYVVQLDDSTVAVITDSAGPYGEGPELAYRPPIEIASFVVWLEQALESVELQPGGPPIDQG
jgi:hypothetical protein